MRIGIVLLTTTLVLVGMPLAGANETQPDCQQSVSYDSNGDGVNDKTGPQPWIAYARTDPVRNAYNNDLGRPGGLNACEGEHWDGQDTVSNRPGNCGGSFNTAPDDLHVSRCMGTNPDGVAGGDPLLTGVRVSVKDGAAYAAINIPLVLGQAATYVDSGTVAIYLRDNTPGNVLATVVSTLRITQGHVEEKDCDQSTYQSGAYSGDARCGRDNTAITVEHGLLA